MNGVDSHQESLKRRRDKKGCPPPPSARFAAGATALAAASSKPLPAPSTPRKQLGFWPLDELEMASAVVPPVTVVLEGRSICHRVYLHKHASYESLALALRRMFVDADGAGDEGAEGGGQLDLSNAVPGHMVAYEDMEDDLLLAGDLAWKDFVRVAKRIRILPAKTTRRKHCAGGETYCS